ncbi:MAG: HD domain-containing phosphohydrolase [Cyanobacteriota bacterium]|nr:HD domain-containing phosphohydrolase [Cyanobacteriota bacterium]
MALRRPSFTVSLVALFVPLVSGLGLLVGWLGYQRSAELLALARNDTLEAMMAELRTEWSAQSDPRLVMAGFDQLMGLMADRTEADWRAALPLMQKLLARTPRITAYYLARPDGSLFRVTRVGPGSSAQVRLPVGAAYLLEAIVPVGVGRRPWVEAFDSQLRSLGPVTGQGLEAYDPRQRPWYRLAQEAAGGAVVSPVHHLQLSDGLGVTISRQVPQGGAVGASVLLHKLEASVAQLRLTPSTQLALVDGQGRLLLTPGSPADEESLTPLAQARQPALAAMVPLLARLPAEMPADRRTIEFKTFQVGRETWSGAAVPMSSRLQGGGGVLLVALPQRELLAGANRLLRETWLLTLLLVLASVPLVWVFADLLARPLRRLAVQAAAIRGFDFDAGEPVRSPVQEIDDLAVTFEGMRTTIRSFLQSSAALGAEPDPELLLERLLVDTIASSGAIAGVLYRAEGDTLLPIHARGLLLPSLPSLSLAAIEAPSVPEAPDPCRLRLPLRSRGGPLHGLLELRFEASPEPARVAFCSALSGSAAVALETRSLIAAQKALFEAFVQLIAGAIDAKSPHTGGHCARVPLLAKALAAAACAASSGPYADFQLTDDDWEALHIAAWLHDCGKVTTPEFVVEKATKLETLHDRIHEVRLRFELLKASAERDHWQAVASGGDPQALQAELEACWAELDADFAFVAACNIGGEVLDPVAVERLERIARRQWRRTLDDRLGISADERRRAEAEPEPALPVLEPLLADRPRHRLPRVPQQRRPAANPGGFTLEEPELLANRGELHNLRVSRGTLNAEERYAINDHIIQTIRMLEALPFPPHLAAVPEIAGGHHERMDGRGYPRSLRGDQMGPLARMMALADVFEALTAADRPYKEGKTLSQALVIMAAMVREGHLDPELFALFVHSGVYRSYGQACLAPAQCDAVDEAALLASLAQA